MPTIDLNSDLGESPAPERRGGPRRLGDDAAMDDAAMFGLVSSANVACGIHAGDPATMLASARLALEHGVTLGAHPSYRDRAGFGRRAMDVEPHELQAEVLDQVSALAGLASSVGASVAYVKPHGALYNRIALDEEQADAVARAAADAGLPLLGLPGSAIGRIAVLHGVPFVAEGFADRAYLADGSLAPRSIPGAVIDDPDAVAERAVRMALEHEVESLDGGTIAVHVASLCVHGDTPGAVELARATRDALEAAGVGIRPFLGAPGSFVDAASSGR
ncbi:5-oxoprolinase subunit PxpA [Galbitalea sp. SE-J8]|uniref:LamB/YcsF family protein n=1 Tax=Galbitalea sp. SE-J8 TaxID=3054952 RepID=UPI00259CAAAB|nr:5-oxoprolinase subunit PxpA [Galbitalea sp. SE-J8]MDM4763794.1 5-oxoprolinase subunit PxpA [Galbitalea sp. SE-J8]